MNINAAHAYLLISWEKAERKVDTLPRGERITLPQTLTSEFARLSK